MSSYFDEVSSRIHTLQESTTGYSTIMEIEEKLVMDVTVCAMFPGFPEDIAERIHQTVLAHGIYCLPVNAPLKEIDTFAEHKGLVSRMCEELHTIFHDLHQRHLTGFNDSPLMPLRALYTKGEMIREIMVDGGVSKRSPGVIPFVPVGQLAGPRPHRSHSWRAREASPSFRDQLGALTPGGIEDFLSGEECAVCGLGRRGAEAAGFTECSGGMLAEERARVLYNTWSEHPNWLPWVDHGNSFMQDKARDAIRREDNVIDVEAADVEPPTPVRGLA